MHAQTLKQLVCTPTARKWKDHKTCGGRFRTVVGLGETTCAEILHYPHVCYLRPGR